ncbi:hypothetical protein B0H13DRAFT_1868537 [Mycena leptocephala]|nr:hypothetical protein B0H13DRAFT_1868537 [Mycena leptocephala]
MSSSLFRSAPPTCPRHRRLICPTSAPLFPHSNLRVPAQTLALLAVATLATSLSSHPLCTPSSSPSSPPRSVTVAPTKPDRDIIVPATPTIRLAAIKKHADTSWDVANLVHTDNTFIAQRPLLAKESPVFWRPRTSVLCKVRRTQALENEMDEPALAIGALGAADIFKQLLGDSESRMGSQMNALMQTGLAVERKQLLKTLKKERELSDRAILGLQAIYRMISSPGFNDIIFEAVDGRYPVLDENTEETLWDKSITTLRHLLETHDKDEVSR